MTNYKTLRALCDAATDGEWRAFDETISTPYVTSMFSGLNDICDLYHKADDGKIYTKENAEANARFIAATDPQTVRALIDEVEKYEKALRFILENSDETLANNVAFKALKGTGNE